MTRCPRPAAIAAAALAAVTVSSRAATLSVQSLTLTPGETGTVIVDGAVSEESTYGVTILLELVPQIGAVGTVSFTPAPPVDIGLAGTPWLLEGTFTPFDTDTTGSLTLNGSVIDDGEFVPAPVTYQGLLAAYPVIADANALGTWDVWLSTSVGGSSWEGISTTLEAGTVTVAWPPGIPTASHWGLGILALCVLTMGTLLQLDHRTGVRQSAGSLRTFEASSAAPRSLARADRGVRSDTTAASRTRSRQRTAAAEAGSP